MTRVVEHATFAVVRHYPVPPARVFAAWADPDLKARWFVEPGAEHALDFRVGGRELYRGAVHTYDARISDIVPDERIVLSPVDEGTRLTYTEQATFLDGADTRRTREGGTRSMLDALGEALSASPGQR